MKRDQHFPGNKCILFFLVLFCSHASYSQIDLGPLEAGITIAPSNFLGDLGGTHGKGRGFLKDNNLSLTKLIVGAHVTVNPSEWLAVRLAVNYGSIAGDDAIIDAKGGLEETRKVRNQDFKSKIAEAFVALELYPTIFLEQDPSDVVHKWRPYGLAGVGVFHFNPQGQDPSTGAYVNLKGLHTEGQGFAEYPNRKEYKLTQMNIPLGFGLKYFFSENVNLSLEVIHRKTFSDYIDDVSTTYIDNNLFYKYLPTATAIVAERMSDKSTTVTNRNAGQKRGTSTNMDGYYSFGIKMALRVGSGSGSGFRNNTRCPKIRL